MHTKHLIHGSGVAFIDGGQDEGLFYLAGRNPALGPPETPETDTIAYEMRVEIITSVEILQEIAKTRQDDEFIRINIRGPLKEPHSRFDDRVKQWVENPQDETGLEMGETNVSLGEVLGLLNDMLEDTITYKLESGLKSNDQRALYERQKKILALINENDQA